MICNRVCVLCAKWSLPKTVERLIHEQKMNTLEVSLSKDICAKISIWQWRLLDFVFKSLYLSAFVTTILWLLVTLHAFHTSMIKVSLLDMIKSNLHKCNLKTFQECFQLSILVKLDDYSSFNTVKQKKCSSSSMSISQWFSSLYWYAITNRASKLHTSTLLLIYMHERIN